MQLIFYTLLSNFEKEKNFVFLFIHLMMFPDFLPNIAAVIEFGDRCIDLIKHHFMEENICNDSETFEDWSDFSEVERKYSTAACSLI